MKFWFQKSKKELQLNYYKSIKRLPVGIWWDIQDDINHLPKLLISEVEIDQEVIKVLFDAWESINDQFIDRFTFGEGHKSLMRAENEMYESKIELLTGDRGAKTRMIIAKGMVDEMKRRNPETQDRTKTTLVMNKELGQPFDENTVSVEKYYTGIELINEWHSKASQKS